MSIFGTGGSDPNGPVIGTATGTATGDPNVPGWAWWNNGGGPTYTAGGGGGGGSSPTSSSSGKGNLSPLHHLLLSALFPPKLPGPPPGANALPGQLLNQSQLDGKMSEQEKLHRLLMGLLQ